MAKNDINKKMSRLTSEALGRYRSSEIRYQIIKENKKIENKRELSVGMKERIRQLVQINRSAKEIVEEITEEYGLRYRR